MERFRQIVHEIMGQEPIKSLDLKFIGMGSNRVVFETLEDDKRIIKIDRNIVEEKLLELLDMPSDDESVSQLQKREISTYKEIEGGIIDFFGDEHVLAHRVFKTKVPFTKETIVRFFDGDDFVKSAIEKLADGVIYEIEMFAEIQPKAEEVINREKFNTKDFRTYRLTEEYFYGAGNVPDALAEVRDLVDDELLSKFDEKFSDERYLNIVKEIVTKIIGYTKKTGLALDILGPNNITIFTNIDGSVDYHLLDVVMPGSAYSGVNIKDNPDFSLLLNYYTFYYSIKSLGEKLGIEDTIEAEDLFYFKGTGIPTEGKLTA